MPPVPELARPVVRAPSRRTLRWLAILVLSVIVHLMAFDVLPHWTIEPADDAPRGETLRATLAPLAPPPEVPVPPTPRPAPTPRPRIVRPDRPPVARPSEPASADVPPQVPAPSAAAPQATPPPAPDPTPTVAESRPSAPPPAKTPVATTPPRSARLDYQVTSQNVKQPNPIYGRGTILWSIGDGRYMADLQAAADLLFFKLDVLSSHSDGVVGPGGLAPDRYTESPRRRATVATNFNRDGRQSVTFSTSAASVPLVDGAQDRLSVLFQLGALLLADPAKAAAGTVFELPVAGVRGEVETWRFEVRGVETLETGIGAVSTTHLQRAPRPGTNDRTIDVWVAQADGGYPARVLYTEPSGNTVMMTLDRISAAP